MRKEVPRRRRGGESREEWNRGGLDKVGGREGGEEGWGEAEESGGGERVWRGRELEDDRAAGRGERAEDGSGGREDGVGVREADPGELD